MRILQEGDRGSALSPTRGQVQIVYEYRDIELESGISVRDVLVGVDATTGEMLTLPAQSTPKIKRARDGAKEQVLTARMPHELDDVLLLVSEHFSVSPAKFSPALIRFYLDEATHDSRLANRLLSLASGRLASARRSSRITVRCGAQLLERLSTLVADLDGASQSDLIRGAIVAAKEDVLEGRTSRRSGRLRAVAAAV